MKNARNMHRRIKWFSAAAVILIIAGLILYRIAAPRVERILENRISETIVSVFGAGTVIGSVDLTWDSLFVNDILIPIGQGESSLQIRRIIAVLHPYRLASQSWRPEQIVSSVHVTGVDFIISSPSDTRQKPVEDESWLPRFFLPPSLFSIGNSYTALSEITFENSRIRLLKAFSDTIPLCDYCGKIIRNPLGYHFSAEGFTAGDTASAIEVIADLSETNRRLDLKAALTVAHSGGRYISPESYDLSATGRILLQMTVTEKDIHYRGSADLKEAQLAWKNESISIPEIRAELFDDTVRVDSIFFTASSFSGVLSGKMQLAARGYVDFTGRLEANNLGRLRQFMPNLPAINGSARVAYSIGGTIAEPFCEAQLQTEDLSMAGYRMNDFGAAVQASKSGAEVCSLSFSTAKGRFSGSGRVDFLPKLSWTGNGNWCFTETPMVLGWKLGVRQVSITGNENGGGQAIQVIALDSCGREMCSAGVSRNQGQWILDSYSPYGGSSKIQMEFLSGKWNVTAKDAHFLIGSLVPDLEFATANLRGSSIRYSGGAEAGDISCDVQSRTDTMGLWSRIARELHFGGQYSHTPISGYLMSGHWEGEAGNGDLFEGQLKVSFSDQVLYIEQLFVDAVGSLSGTVDLHSKQLDVELTVDDLALGKLPMPPNVLERFEARGTLGGYLRMQGPFVDPEWVTGFAMTNGSVFGVPGYWMNLDASGKGLSATIETYELGRGIRKIIRAEGKIDGKTGRLDLNARIGSARAEDFILALTGKRGILSGEMDGRGTIVGMVDHPEVEADVAVRGGELLNEIHIDEFNAVFQIGSDSIGNRLISIPRCRFSKQGVYDFSGTAALSPVETGMFQAHIEGHGDFLDILDQMDKTFRTEGSEGAFSLNFGGTFDHPRFLGSELRVHNGKFVYTDATPGVVNTELAVRIDSVGRIDSGFVRFQSDNQWLELKSLQSCDTSLNGLIPLAIRTPRICLGILEMRTGTGGMPLRLPGLMKPEWTGVFSVGTGDVPPIIVSGSGDDRLKFAGGMVVRNSRITFPFVRSGSGPMRKVARWIVDRLTEADWDLDITVGAGNHYDVEITGLKDSDMFAPLRGSQVFETIASYVDHLSIDAIIEPADSPLQVHGNISENNFHLNGRVASNRGNVDYLDQSFQIEYVYSDFDETDVMPILEGRARTTGQDSLGRDVPIYLTMYQLDRETGIRQERGRLNNITYVLEGEGGETPERILQYMGYNPEDMTGKAGQLMASTVVRAIGRRWLDPLERRLERWTMLDEITFTPGRGTSPSTARAQRVAAQTDTLQQNSMIRFFTGSQFTVGKYLTRDLFLTYTGELTEGQIELGNRLGFVHVWNLEYRINPMSRDLVLDFAVEYDELERKRDESVSLKYTFALEP